MSFINLDKFYGRNLLEVFLFSSFVFAFKVNSIIDVYVKTSLSILDDENMKYSYA